MAIKYRTNKGNVTAKARKNTAVLNKGRFPIFDKKSAASAIKLRGHTKTKAERRKIINKAAKFQPRLAKEAKKRDKLKALI
jgi:hypothetical protein